MQSRKEIALDLWDCAVAAWRADPYRPDDWQRHNVASMAGVDAVLFLATTFYDPIQNARYAPNAARLVCSPAGVSVGL